jgi:hypothetical protein
MTIKARRGTRMIQNKKQHDDIIHISGMQEKDTQRASNI